MFATLYQIFGYLGLASIFGALLAGFRADPSAGAGNFAIDLALYAVFAAPHLIMTRARFKQAVWGAPQGSIRERQVYIATSVVTWILLYISHRPLPGVPELPLPPWLLEYLPLIGYSCFVLCIMAFFQGATFAMINGLLGVPGTEMGFSHGRETPLFTDGPYAEVRHPMYRAAVLAGLSSLIIHPHLAQLFWAGLIGGTFIAFIPVEEGQLIAARGQAYLDYRVKTRYRLFRGIW